MRIEGEPRCEPEHEAVPFSVRNADGKLKRIRVVPSRHQDPEAKTEFSPVLSAFPLIATPCRGSCSSTDTGKVCKSGRTNALTDDRYARTADLIVGSGTV